METYQKYLSNNEISSQLSIGLIGERGPTGPKGNDGRDGCNGIPGPCGPMGVQGNQGMRGPMGIQGAQGFMGIQGIQGAIGPKGDKGEKGEDGYSYFKRVLNGSEEIIINDSSSDIKIIFKEKFSNKPFVNISIMSLFNKDIYNWTITDITNNECRLYIKNIADNGSKLNLIINWYAIEF